MKRRRGAGQSLAVLSVIALAHDARGQVRTDAELLEGAELRVLSHRPLAAGDATASPTMDLEGHVALVPLLRVGAYAHYDVSPLSGEGSRQLASGGLDLRVTLPWLRGGMRAYARLGLGEVGTAVSAHVLGPNETRGALFVPSSSGSFTEVPLALGFAYRLERSLWLTAEAGARLGFGFGGSAYGGTGSGNDVAAIFLDAGVSWGR